MYPLTDTKEVNEMKEGIHPKYEQTTSATLSIPASRSWLTPVDGLIASTSVLA